VILESAAANSMSAAKPKVVVVDDDPGMSQAVRRLLDVAGFNVVTFASAEALLEGHAAASAACMILDLHLPGMSGFELQQRLRGRGVETPIIFVTAHDSQAAREQAERAGAMAYLTKPFSGKTLLQKVHYALATRPANDDVKKEGLA
jgi:FixJ family two-component response regulator